MQAEVAARYGVDPIYPENATVPATQGCGTPPRSVGSCPRRLNSSTLPALPCRSRCDAVRSAAAAADTLVTSCSVTSWPSGWFDATTWTGPTRASFYGA